MTEGLGLHQIKTRTWSIFKTSAVKGEGCARRQEKQQQLKQRASWPGFTVGQRSLCSPSLLTVLCFAGSRRLWEGMDWLSNVLKTRR